MAIRFFFRKGEQGPGSVLEFLDGSQPRRFVRFRARTNFRPPRLWGRKLQEDFIQVVRQKTRRALHWCWRALPRLDLSTGTANRVGPIQSFFFFLHHHPAREPHEVEKREAPRRQEGSSQDKDVLLRVHAQSRQWRKCTCNLQGHQESPVAGRPVSSWRLLAFSKSSTGCLVFATKGLHHTDFFISGAGAKYSRFRGGGRRWGFDGPTPYLAEGRRLLQTFGGL